MKKIASIAGAAAMCVTLSGCYTAQVSAYCRDFVLQCMVIGAVASVGLVFMATTLLSAGQHHQPYHHHYTSDRRLKEGIRHLYTLQQGVRVYSFRYIGDSRQFTGLMAQDLLEDERFRGAVGKDANGFYFIDYEALGLEIRGAEEMLRAGARASELAS